MEFSYLDNNAGTGLADGVLDAMLPYLQQQQGNPSSSHRFGRFALTALDQARQQVAELVKVHPSQVIFTSGGTEANNQVLASVSQLYSGGDVIISPIEHPSILEPAARLTEYGFDVTHLAVDKSGRVNEDALSAVLTNKTRLVSVMWANNETGLIQDIKSLSRITRKKQIPFHCDAVQAAGKLEINFNAVGVQSMSLSAHKFGGPKGIGALIVSHDFDCPAFIVGGGQENGLRSGTENVPAIVGFGAAAQSAVQNLERYQRHCRRLRDLLEVRLQSLPEVTIFAKEANRLANTVFFSVQGFDAETLLMTLDRQGIAVSSGSACGTGQQTPSHVLTAMGIDDVTALGAIRVSVSQYNTLEQIEQLVVILTKEVDRFKHLMNR
ncbi:MAG: cysteine desulfurase [Gammaproteobacteria bacterium]|nr:MAG: cysteine desulfurase [Gammaproteobacteria bacterium]RKZ94415.1 MAG: cysteine desulfurase [Gammaproteobacteria bacterium]RKZ98261.1 MAG: cysteine desulfurase [Gammaproteobacteria bacterium]